MSREIELKLELEEGSAEALKRHPMLGGDPLKSADQLSTYFDTPDHLLRTAGFSLRVRQSSGRFVQTVKQSDSASAGLFDRPEWEEEIDGSTSISTWSPARRSAKSWERSSASA
jgi:inorganic triphosphatase YgiF